MAFLSELIGTPVVDVEGKLVGKLKDLIAREKPDFPHPVIQALVIRRKTDEVILPSSEAAALVHRAVPLKHTIEEIQPYKPGDQDIFLARDALDRQIIDTEGARVVRVNDLELVRVKDALYVGNVDVGGLGILRRLGLAGTAQGISSRVGLKLSRSYIPWNDVELIHHDQSMRLRVPVEKLADLHPADVAEILVDLNRQESGQFLDALDMESLADTLEEVEPDYQASLVSQMPDEKIADVLEEMEPDEAADLLAEFPKERSQDLLALMEISEAEDVRKLLAYPEDSAGGIMTTEFAAVRPNLTAGEAIDYLRVHGQEAETIFYVYVTDDQDHLMGVFSLGNMIFAQPDASVSEFMQTRVISANLVTRQDDVAQLISKYNLLALPVVDDENRMHGIVTADDALDKIIPTAWKKRLPRFFR